MAPILTKVKSVLQDVAPDMPHWPHSATAASLRHARSETEGDKSRALPWFHLVS